jgi:acetylornithine/N-succinyldiaminopimelate aminotransferase
MLFEPGSSSGLVRFPPEKLVRAIATAVRDDGGLVVALGKGIGNGYPVSVAAFSPRALRILGDRVIPYAQSHQNDPVGATVAREVIRILREER